MKNLFFCLSMVLAIFCPISSGAKEFKNIPTGINYTTQERISLPGNSNRKNLTGDFILYIAEDDISDSETKKLSSFTSDFEKISILLRYYQEYTFKSISLSKFYFHFRPLLFIFLCVFRL